MHVRKQLRRAYQAFTVEVMEFARNQRVGSRAAATVSSAAGSLVVIRALMLFPKCSRLFNESGYALLIAYGSIHAQILWRSLQ